jgi:hypothetical protein
VITPSDAGRGGALPPGAAGFDLSRELDQLLDSGRSGDARPEDVQRGLAQLVLTLVEVLRELMERQALRRMEAGSLDDDEIERLGSTFIALRERMDELKEVFDLTDEDLNLDLGPLGRLR